jgi:hypothetical protein
MGLKNLDENLVQFLRAGGSGAAYVIYLFGGVVEASVSPSRLGSKVLLMCFYQLIGICECQYPS